MTTIGRAISLALIIFCISSVSFGQQAFKPGYVITLENDTLAGQIKNTSYSESSEVCIFRDSLQGRTIRYSPGEIAGYKISEDQYYVSLNRVIPSGDEIIFAQYLLEGKEVDLYLVRENDQTNRYYLRKGESLLELKNNLDTVYVQTDGGGNVMKVKENKEYTGVLKYAFSDQWDIVSKVDRTNFDSRSLVKLTKEYHRATCPDESCIVYLKKRESVKFSVGPLVSFSLPSYYGIHYGAVDRYVRYNSGMATEYGVQVRAIIPQTKERIAARLRVRITDYSFSFTESFELFDWEISESARSIAVGLGASYSVFKSTKLNFYAATDISINRLSNQHAQFARVFSADLGTSEPVQYPEQPFLRGGFNVDLSIGAEIILTDWIGVFAEGGYEMIRNIHGSKIDELKATTGLLIHF